MLPLVAILLAGTGAAPLRAASPALRAAARRDVAAFLDGQPAGASVEALVAAFAARRAAREPDRAAGVHALKRALLKRRLFDVHAMADAADASVLDGSCACPLTADECAETTVYNNTLLHRPSDGSPMELYYRETQPLDAMLAGDAHCQELQGFEVCDDSPDCVPSTASLIYDCDAAAATMLGVAQVRSAELDNDDAEVYAALADRTSGAVTGDDDMFYGLTSQTVYVYTLLELQGQVTCSDGCNFYDACKTSCGGLAAEGADQSLDLDTSCTGVLAHAAAHGPPSLPLPVPDPTTTGAGGGNGGGRGSRTDDGAGGVAPAPTPAPTPATITTSSSKKDDDDTDAAGGILALIIIAVLVVLLALLYYLKKRRDEAAAEAEAPPPELEAPPPPVAVDDVEADAARSTAIKTKINEAEL
ncbi:hypothetical protein JL720_6697 [Aureococcus anophagefferens]|nr:hypothetical protein JL720_6697 [Aureococcus anophagefferens]